MEALRAKVRLGEPSVQRFAARGGKLVEELAAVTPATQRADQPVALEALERRVNLADIDFPGTAEQRFKTVFHLVSVERLLGEEAQHPVPKRHYPYSVCIKSMHRSQRQCQHLFFDSRGSTFGPPGTPRTRPGTRTASRDACGCHTAQQGHRQSDPRTPARSTTPPHRPDPAHA